MTIKDTSTHSQRIAILQRLKQGSLSTLEARQMGICSPAPRIMELRKKGYDISTTTKDEVDHAGVTHKGIAVYTLHHSPEKPS